MTSPAMRVIAVYLRLTAKPRMSTADRARRRMAGPKGDGTPPPELRQRHSVTSRQVQGFTVWTVTPGVPSRAAVYLHGGAYVSRISPQHWDLVARLADAGVRVEVPLYGLAPQHTYRNAYPFVTEVYRQLLDEVPADRIGIAGDSAGGGLALGLVQTLGEAGLPQPSRLVLIAPWLDLTLSGEGVDDAARHDPWLTPIGLVTAGEAWAGGDDPSGARVSPLNGPLAGLPPTEVYIGGRDLFRPDVLRLARRAEEAAWPLDVVQEPGAVHVYPLVPAPEGRRARDRIVETLSR